MVSGDFVIALGDKAGNARNVRRYIGSQIQALRFGHGGLPALHRVDQVGFNLIKLRVRNIAGKGDHFGAGYPGTFSCGEQLNTLGGAVCPLVVLAGQELHGKHPLAGGEGYFVCRIVQIVLGKDPVHGTAELRLADALHIVAVNKPQAGERCNAHILAQIR